MARTSGKIERKAGWWMPAYEEHLPEWMENQQQRRGKRLCYQLHKYQAAIPHLKHNKLAIDIGAHIGLWSYHMALDFQKVVSFEPFPLHQDCFVRNMAAFDNVKLERVALGPHDGKVELMTRTHGSSGDTGIVGDGKIPMKRLDDYHFDAISLIKIDCEGYEASVIIGAMGVIQRHKPTIIVEQKGDMSKRYGHEPLTAVKMLEQIGMVQKGS